MGKHAIVVMSAPGEANPGDQGRMVHAMTLARDLRDAGEDVQVHFHGIGTRWLAAMADPNDAFTRHYGKLFDEIGAVVAGACDFCTSKRFGASEGATKLGVDLLGPDDDHHSVAALLAEGYQLHNF